MSIRRERPKTVAFRVSVTERAELMREAHERGVSVDAVLRLRVFPDEAEADNARIRPCWNAGHAIGIRDGQWHCVQCPA